MNYSAILSDLTTLVKEVGAFMKNERLDFNFKSVEIKGYNNMVSYVDKEAEKKIIYKLQQLVPEAGFITEEDTLKTSSDKAMNWIIDPLDGTTNYLHGSPIYGINIALAKKEDVLIAVTYLPQLDLLYTATKGNGTYKNGNKITCSGTEKLKDSLIMLGFPYDQGEYENKYAAILKEINASTHGFRQTGCAALDMALVAEGAADAYIEFNVFPWDIIPGILLIKEAGGTISDFNGGNNYWEGKEIVAATKNHSEIINLIQKHW